MATAVPIDHPSLVLGGVVQKGLLALTSSIAQSQSKIDAVQQRLSELDQTIKDVATEYMSTRIAAESAIQKAREEIAELPQTELMESPVDYAASLLRRLPLGSDSLKLDAQYFSCIGESAEDVAASIERFVRESAGGSGSRRPAELSKDASAQAARQLKSNSLTGTLVIAASCTHRNVAVFEPLVIDPDKAVANWNELFPSERLSEQREQMHAIAGASETDAGGNAMSLVSGVTYGSSFIGMVHFLKNDAVQAGADEDVTRRLKERLQIGGWLENASGGMGIDRATLDEVKKILSTQTVSAHVSVVVAGALPSIASNELKLSISQVAQPDAAKSLELLELLNADESSEQGSINADASRSKRIKQAVQMQNARAGNLVRTLSDVDRASNRVLDVNSLMAALENYIAAIHTDGVGVPTGFYVRHLRKQEIARLWLKRYYTDGPDSAVGGTKRPAGGTKSSIQRES
jgi:hypothetical protein